MARRTAKEVKALVKQVKEMIAGGKTVTEALKEVDLSQSTYHYAVNPKTKRRKNVNRLPAGRSASYGKDLLILVPLGDGTTRGFTIKQAAAVYDYLHLLRHTLKDANGE